MKGLLGVVGESWANMAAFFAYGTLRRGGGNDRLLAGEGEFRAVVKTREKYIMLTESGMFPYLVPVTAWPEQAAKATNITGDLYSVSEKGIAAMDELEGHPTWYKRTAIPLEGGGEAWAYILTKEVFDKMKEYDLVIIKSGDWFNA